MPSDVPGVNYAIFRTRLQPFNLGHQWAIELFFNYSGTERLFSSNRLWLGVVDPGIHHYQISQGHPRALPELNPFEEWQVAELAQLMTCRSNFYCTDIVQMRIPSFMSVHYYLSYERDQATQQNNTSMRIGGSINHVRAFRKLVNRVPHDRVWYFPVFDFEDILDIELIWDCLGPEKVIVAHHPKFKFDLQEPLDNYNRYIGAYAAAFAQVLGFKFNGGSVLPDKVLNYIDQLRELPDFKRRLDEARAKIARHPDHPFLTDGKFVFVERRELVNHLQKKFTQNFGATGKTFDDFVKFLPPEPGSDEYAMQLRKLAMSEQNPGSQRTIAPLVDDLEFKLPPDSSRLDTIAKELAKVIPENRLIELQQIREKFSKHQTQ